ncbi:rho GTPase-activating protein 23-like isoform X2 [Myxocyprinus asiaticus]|uniref:rho GTPase-activating protein 23-like isoform X2 n=1 Tax=Myxocyprinus asiaticus TaxID=70543 RepID=UPI002223E48A|nr:rho GTPase-activating protein 23-like isoform X2 [Myxocyprinus asiaticus]
MNGVAFCLVGIPPNAETGAKGHKDGGLSSSQKTRPMSGDGVAWKGPRTVVLQKNSQGFGFTLRHFIVYPPESALHTKDEENGNGKGGYSSHLEPMDTIFVKNVKEKGPAHQAGLCTGDRLVKVNGESVLGKTYSQVIALIQNSENVLELSIMPKDEDVLQLAYSQDAYLRGNEPYTGEAQNLPEPPPICYPSSKPTSTTQNHGLPDNLNCKPNPPLDKCSRGDSSVIVRHDLEGIATQHALPSHHRLTHHRARSSSSAGITISPLDFHFANHNAAIASATLPHPRKGSLPQARSELCHQALSDWYYIQAERPGLAMSHHHRSISQDRLSELGLALRGSPGGWPHSASQDTLLLHYSSAIGANHSPRTDSYGLGRWGMSGGQTSSRSCSENLLAAYASYEQSYGRSLETLEKASIMISPRYERSAWPHQSNQPMKAEERPSLANHCAIISTSVPPSGRASSHAHQQQQMGPQSQQAAQIKHLPAQTVDDQTVGYRSYSPSFCRKATHLMQQSHSFRDPSYTGPHLSWTPKSSSPESMASGRESSPQSLPPTAEPQDSMRAGSGLGGFVEELVQAQIQEVVLRQKPPSGRKTPHGVRHPHYALPVDSSEPLSVTAPASWSGDPVHHTNGGLPPPPVEQDSLAGIPFIDEPTSPSVDLCARHVPASSVVSSNLCQVSAHSTNPVSPILTSPLTSLFYTDCSNIKNSRRSSYLLAITTERSKSCDEGLNTFREEGRVFTRLPKRVKSFFADGSLESLRVAEEARSKRHSTSELGSITLSDIRKEGWLHYKQILTEKGKKVGGGMRPWKRVFSVLRSHSLFLFKDKREAVLHSAGAGSHGNGQGEDEQPISIRGCLIDIAYSETKRKHTLRLTTQDFCEYLLQAEDRDDMLSWIRVIRENSKTDNEELGFSRQALINKRLNDYRKQSPTSSKPDTSPRIHRMMPPFLISKTENTSGVNRTPGKDDSNPPKAPWGINIMKKGKKTGPKAFGVRLEDCPHAANNKFVPQIVETCCRLVEEMGLEYTGIYRVPGNNAMVSSLQDQLNKGLDINTAEERWQDLNVISSLLKSFFRKLPEPLFTDDKYNDFIDANRLEDAGNRLKTMRKLIRDLPDHYYHTLKFLIGHLKTVADHSEKNKMEPRNLALVFGPTLVRTSEDNMTDMVTHMPDRYKIIENLIVHHMWFFSDELDKDEKTPEDQQDVQPVPNIDHLLSNIGRTLPLGDSSDSINSDSAKPKGASASKKDLSAKDFLPLSIISAVTRKRKKHQSTCPSGSSTDEDSEHEPIKASNFEEMNKDRDGGSKARPRTSEGKTEVGKMEGTQEQVEEDQEGARVTEEESVVLEKGEVGIGVEVCEREQTGLMRSQRPRSFLYSHHQSVSGLRASSQQSNSSSSTCSISPQPSSITANLLTRRKLRGERVRSHSLYVEQSRTGEEQGSGTLPVTHTRPLGFSRVKASLVRGQERLRQAVSPSRSTKVLSYQQSWMSQEQASLLAPTDGFLGVVGQQRPESTETRHRRRDWRRHTVLVNMPGEG